MGRMRSGAHRYTVYRLPSVLLSCLLCFLPLLFLRFCSVPALFFGAATIVGVDFLGKPVLHFVAFSGRNKEEKEKRK